MKIKTVVSLLALSPVLAWATEPAVVLSDFDGLAAPSLKITGELEVSDADGDGDQEGVIHAPQGGFATVIKYMVPRAQAAALLQTSPVLRGKVSAVQADNQGKFIAVVPIVQTDATDKEVYDALMGYTVSPIQSKDFAFNLKDAQTKEGMSLADLLTEFANGKGSFLAIGLVQHSPKNQASTVTYDDLQLAPAE